MDKVENSFTDDVPLAGDVLMNTFADGTAGSTLNFYGERFFHG